MKIPMMILKNSNNNIIAEVAADINASDMVEDTVRKLAADIKAHSMEE